MIKSQSILEYIIMLTAVIVGIMLGTVGLSKGVKSGQVDATRRIEHRIDDMKATGETIKYNVPINESGAVANE